MPHLIIEYSANVAAAVDPQELVDALHDAALASEVAPLDALRTRAVPREQFAIADRHPDNGFVAVTARLGAGRSDEERDRLIDALLGALDEVLGDAQATMMLSVEYQEIDPTHRVNRNNLRPVIAERESGRSH